MKNLTKKTLTLAAALCLAGGYAAHTQFARADDMAMSKDKDMMMQMDMMKKMMSDPANKPTADDMAKAKAMHEMVMMMAHDPECKKMCMDMMGDKMMMPSDDAVKMAKEAMMKDPAMMKMVMAESMMMASMMDKGMDKGMGMDKDMGDKPMGMDHGQNGGMAPAK